jgi:hypothetical protein
MLMFSRVLALCAMAVTSLCCAAGAQAATLGEIAQVGGFGTGPGQFSWPSDVAVDSADNSVFVLDEPGASERGPNAVFRIQKFNQGLGAPVGSVEIQTPEVGGVPQVVNGIAVDPKLKRLYALVAGSVVAERILAFSTEQNAEGKLPPAPEVSAGVFYEFPTNLESGSVQEPGGLAVDPVNDALLVFGMMEEPIGSSPRVLIQQVLTSGPPSYAAGSKGETFIDSEGHELTQSVEQKISGLTVGPEGDVYVVGKYLAGGLRGVDRMKIEGEEMLIKEVNGVKVEEKVARSLANPGIVQIADIGYPQPGNLRPLTGGVARGEGEGAEQGATVGEQVSLAPEGGIVYASEHSASGEENGQAYQPAGNYELRGMSTVGGTQAAVQVRVFGGGPGGEKPECHISTEANTVAAGSKGIVYALDEGALEYEKVTKTFYPSSYGFRLIEFGPGGHGCPTPVAAFKIDGKSEAEAPTVTVKKGASVEFVVLTEGFNGEAPETYKWDLDGSGKYSTVRPGSEWYFPDPEPFLKPGTYTIGLEVIMPKSNGYGNPERATRTLVVEPTPPKASFEVFPSVDLGVAIGPGQQVKPGEQVTFNGKESEDPTGECSATGCKPGHTLKSYTWSFGDGKTETTITPEYTRSFSNPSPQARSETVKLTVTNKEGIESTSAAEQTITIEGTPEPPHKEPVKEAPKEAPKDVPKEAPKEHAKQPAKAPAGNRPLTKAQKLALAIKACKKDRSKKARQRCEKAATQKYAPKHKHKNKNKR